MTTAVDEPMTAEEYRAALDKLGINQQAAGRVFGVGSRTAGRWAQGQARVPVVVAMLLHVMVKKRLKLKIPIWNESIREFDRTQIWQLTAERKLE